MTKSIITYNIHIIFIKETRSAACSYIKTILKYEFYGKYWFYFSIKKLSTMRTTAETHTHIRVHTLARAAAAGLHTHTQPHTHTHTHTHIHIHVHWHKRTHAHTQTHRR